MATPSPQVIVEWIVDEATNKDFRPLRDVITQVLSFRLPEISPEETADLAEKHLSAVARELEDTKAKDSAEGVTSGFELSTEGVSSYFRVLETPEIPALENLRAMPPPDFEKFCAKVLSGLGADASTTGGSHDGGVDFVAFDLQLGKVIHFAPRASHVLLVGQAKRYKEGNNITLNDVRAFIGAALLRADQLRTRNPTDVGLLSPIVYAYWTTSDFHHQAKKYARAMGMWYLNGVGLAQLAQRAGIVV